MRRRTRLKITIFAMLAAVMMVGCGDDDGSDANPVWYQDQDSDGYYSGVKSFDYEQPVGFVPAYLLEFLTEIDCNDTDPAINPGALEIAGDMIDNDCQNGDALPAATWYLDADGDGYTSGASQVALSQPLGYVRIVDLVSNLIDCDDTNASINPGGTEICDDPDNADEDCSGSICETL